MIEFIQSCYRWVAENYKEITMILTSTQFISLVSALLLILKNIKRTDENVASSKALKASLETTNLMSETVIKIEAENAALKNQNEKLESQLTELKESTSAMQETLIKKLNCMLEVQSIVYSTIKDDTIRNTVNSILVNAKYAETETREKLKNEISVLKTKLEEEANKVKGIADKAADTISKIVEPEKNDYVRY